MHILLAEGSAMRLILAAGLVTALAVAGNAQQSPTPTGVIDEFRAVDWDSRAKSAKPDPADEAWRIRARAEHVLIGMDPAPVAELVALLGDDNRHVRGLAALCLGAIGDDTAVEPLKTALSEDPDSIVRVYAAEALGRLGDPSAVEALTEAEAGENRSVAYAAHTAKERLVNGPAAGSSLRDAAKIAADFDALATPAVGEPAPEIELISSDGEPMKLSSIRGKPGVVLFQLADW